ncbi:MAG: hypothetical protein H7Y86_00360 [Rhizobacter sp.]|nr:hypothetical protein [Ferruginibacter sp.]
MNYSLIIFFVFLFHPVFSHAQDKPLNNVLNKGIVNRKTVFGKWTEDGGIERHLTYLGHVKISKGKIYKIVNSSHYWGLSHRASSRILIFNVANQYVGEYYVTIVNDLPGNMENGN